MKRISLVILWTIVFAILTLLGGMLCFGLLGFAGIASWKPSIVVLIGRTWSILAVAVPLLGLALGLLGKLPGTRRAKLEGTPNA